MQVTLSRQTGAQPPVLRRLHLRPDARDARRRVHGPSTRTIRTRTYGVLDEDRTHVLNVSWNAFLPDGAKGAMDNAFGRGLLERLAGVGHLVAGQRHSVPARLQRRGGQRLASRPRYFGTADVVGPSPGGGNGLAPVYTCDPTPRRQERRREDPRHQLHRGPGIRRERRPGAALQHAAADADRTTT